MLNTRGQDVEIVNKSVEYNKKFECILKDHIKSKYDIDLIKKDSKFKPYDFHYNKIHKIEYKGLYYSLDDNKNIAISIKDDNKKIWSVMISKTKIKYYKIRQVKNPLLRFYLIYGFYTVITDDEYKIDYRYINISDLDKIILNNKTMIFLNAVHYMIPIEDLKELPKENPFIL